MGALADEEVCNASSRVQSKAIARACALIINRNAIQVDSYREVVDGYARYMTLAASLKDTVDNQSRQIVALKDEKNALITELSEATKAALQGPEALALQERCERLQVEVGDAYRSSAQASQQLVQCTNSLQSLKEENEDRGKRIETLEDLLDAARQEAAHVRSLEQQKDDAVAFAAEEAARCRAEVATIQEKMRELEGENKMLIERWLELKMQEVERINEANSIYEDLMCSSKAGHLEALSRSQVDGIVRHIEAGAEHYVTVGVPSKPRLTLRAHEGGCSAMCFDKGGGRLLTGGQDRVVKIWDALGPGDGPGGSGSGVTPTDTLRGSLGAVLDLSIAGEGKMVLGASSDHKLYLWDMVTARIKHTLTGHSDKVVATDVSRTSAQRAVSAAHDRTIKIWDLERGYGITTIICHSNSNDVCWDPESVAICSAHVDGHIRVWDARTGRLTNEVAAHSQGITSLVLSRSGHTMLTCGRDNVVHLFDIRTMERRVSFRARELKVATNWSRVCMSPDEKYIAAGSADGVVVVWDEATPGSEKVLRGHKHPVLACCWSVIGQPLATADKIGTVIIWG